MPTHESEPPPLVVLVVLGVVTVVVDPPALTTMVPVMPSAWWIVHTYGNLPVCVKVCENMCGVEATPESHVSGPCMRVVVCVPLIHCHTTVSPGAMVMVSGENR